ncbi:MAG TPA: ferritin-like domain-containing protein [Bryobacteraceae bacterium]|jgi:ferritin-like metal-binding protein YciE|nr:ferritin-like domain-containing protein [Bryobacteraceae bacterium]
MNTEQLQELLIDNVRDIYDAEKQLVKALPKMAKAADSEELAEGIEQHLEETKGQVERLEKVFDLLDVPAKGKTCKGMKGLIDEGAEALEDEAGPLRDLAIIAAAQRVEHYEISAYGTARAIAEQMGNGDVAELLQQTEDEEKAADENLSRVAMMLYESDADEEGSEEVMTDEEDQESSRKGPSHADAKPASQSARKRAASR